MKPCYRFKSFLALAAILVGISSRLMGQGADAAEDRFKAMLENASLEGSWAPIQQGRLGADREDDRYQIARAEKSGEGEWSIVSVFTMGEREIEFPIPCEVKFAGDTAVLILDDVRAGPGAANWSARVMFHEDVYTGRWWETGNPEHGGTIAGTVKRPAGEAGGNQGKGAEKLYELRFYRTHEGKLTGLHKRFRDHTMRLFEKHGMENIVYWSVVEGARGEDPVKDNLLIYIIAHENEEARQASWKAFRNDPEWQKVREESEQEGPILAEAPRSILMSATDFSNELVAAKDPRTEPRLFELRQYNDGPDRVPGTVDRFASGEKDLFTKHGMETLAFWTAEDQSAFIYLLAHKDREASRQSWAGFFPDFRDYMTAYQKASEAKREAPQPGGKVPRPSGGMEIRFLVPTDYSPLK